MAWHRTSTPSKDPFVALKQEDVVNLNSAPDLGRVKGTTSSLPKDR